MSKQLKTLSEALTRLVAASSPAVVRIRGGRRRSASGTAWGEELVVVADHTLHREEGLTAQTEDGRSHAAELVGRDPSLDLALLRVPGAGLSPLPRGEAALAPGNLVVLLGRPGDRARATLGMISDVAGAWSTPAGGRADRYLEVDAALPTGFSGGPLLDASGAVLGVNTAGLVPGGTTLPASTVDAAVARLTSGGSVKRGYLGVGVQPVVIPEALRETAGQDRGALIISVEDGGPAEGAGLTLGDTLLALDGEPVRSVRDLFAALATRGGTTATARVLRAGAVEEVAIPLGERQVRSRRRQRRRCG